MAKRYDILVRLLIIGDSGVGKTCMIWRFADDDYHPDEISTIGIDFRMKRLELDGKTVRLQLWDTAGQERFETLTKQYYRRAQGVLLVYDITKEKSFLNIPKWIERLKECSVDEVDMVLVANKCDMTGERLVSKESGANLAKSLHIPFYETSAKNSANIKEVFLGLAKRVIRRHKKEFDAIQLERKDSDGGEYISELLREKQESSSCCVLT